jgi:DNA polymerase-1
MDIASLGKRASALSPMGGVSGSIMPERVLYADGDGLAYYCAGSDETSPDRAVANLRDKLNAAKLVSQAGRVQILSTASGSDKGKRYAIARAKPYQGQRVNSRRPKNWELLRSYVTEPRLFPVFTTGIAEADDLFAEFGFRDPHNTVILTQDKDMRMVPGWHLDWNTHTMFFLEPTTYKVRHNDKWYGWHWFWLQMLQGDTADNIPGLPKYRPSEKAAFKLCGEKTAEKLLDDCTTNIQAAIAVLNLYKSYYGADAEVNMLEQACLLWMRPHPADYFSCLSQHGPLFPLRPSFVEAAKVIEERVKEADIAPAQDD